VADRVGLRNGLTARLQSQRARRSDGPAPRLFAM